MPINREATIRWKGYDPNDLKPNSSERVWNNCIDCGKGRWVQFNASHDRCNSCAQFLNKSFISKDTRMNMSDGQKKRFEDPNEIELNRLRATKQWESDSARETQRKNSIKQWASQNTRDEMSIIMKQFYVDNPEACEIQRRNSLVQWSNIEACERMSAIQQGIPYCEWEGFCQDDWRNWHDTILLNDPFPGCHRHHITKTLAICIPDELHKHVRHVLKTGENMGGINMLALQYMNGGL